MALADAMASTWIFDSREDAKVFTPGTGKRPLEIPKEHWERAQLMAKNILEEQMSAAIGDVNENATQFVVDWALSNRDSFGERAVGTCLGMIQNKRFYIFPSMLTQALTKAGYSSRKTMKYLADQGLIGTSTDKNGKTKNSVIKWFDNRNCRFVELFMDKLEPEKDPLTDEDSIADGMKKDEYQQMNLPGTQPDEDGFVQIPEGMDDELPF